MNADQFELSTRVHCQRRERIAAANPNLLPFSWKQFNRHRAHILQVQLCALMQLGRMWQGQNLIRRVAIEIEHLARIASSDLTTGISSGYAIVSRREILKL
ncbi:hypothetical protein D9M71_835900 [compost metagenome]